MKQDDNSSIVRRWVPALLLILLGLVVAVLTLYYLRVRYDWDDILYWFWQLAVHLSHTRLAIAIASMGLAVWLTARWLSGAHVAHAALAAFGLGVLVDAIILLSLEPLRISFGPLLLPLALLAAVRGAVALVLVLLTWLLHRVVRPASTWPLLHAAAQVLIAVVVVDGMVIEPARLTVSRVSVQDPYAIASSRPLRIVQISDLHIERVNDLTDHLVAQVNSLEPDLIVLTGDFLNSSFTTDPQAQADLVRVLGALRAKEGIYAVRGNVDAPAATARLLSGLPIVLLEGEWVNLEIGGHCVSLCGVPMDDLEQDRRVLADLVRVGPHDCFRVLLYHSPNLVPEAVAAGFDLFPTGHTHGGQIRLPFYGALMTSCIYGKRYEMGPYHVGNTLIYVSRGIGMEGWLVPRMRFLCPPEIVVYDIK